MIPVPVSSKYSRITVECFYQTGGDREDTAVFLYREQGAAAGFPQWQLRHDYVEGTETSPVGYPEGIYIREGARRQDIARRLLSASES